MTFEPPHRLCLLAAALSVALPAFASSSFDDETDLLALYGDKASVSIATGSAQPLRRAPAVASVITAEDIAAMGATDLDQVLEAVPGIHVLRSPVFYTPLYAIRGVFTGTTTNPQVLMLQNGIPLTTVYSGDKGISWRGFPLDNVARIEVIRGPGSALYGADAYAGVINIVTRTAADTRGTTVGAHAGSFDSHDAWVLHGGRLGPVDVAAYLRVGHSAGFRSTIDADAQTRLDGLFHTHASLAPGPVNVQVEAVDANVDLALGNWRLRAGYQGRDDAGVGAGVSSALDPSGRGFSHRVNADLSWADPSLADDWSAGATLSYQGYVDSSRLTLFPPGATFPTGAFPEGVKGGPDRWDRTVRLSAFGTYTGMQGHKLRIGAGHDLLQLYRAETHKNYLLSPAGVPIPTGPVIEYSAIQPHILPHGRRDDYVYLQDEWNIAPDWTLTGGWRHDHYSDFGATSNPRIALVWDASLDLTAKLLYGQAFRAPSFSEYYGVNPVANGNAALKPETIATLELALSWQARSNLQLNLNAFRHRLRDVITLVQNPAPAPGSTYQNAARMHAHGAELELVWDATRRLRLSGNLAWQHSVNESTGQDAGYTPRLHAYLRADWHAGADWLLSTQINRVAGRHRAAGDNRPPVPDYTTADLHLRHERGAWTLSAGVNNLFKADVREPSLAPGTIPHDLPMAPRSFAVEAAYRF